jgi:DNA-binding NarL/FixJ family response regulator
MDASTPPVTLLIADEQPLVRETFVHLAAALAPEIRVIEAGTAAEAVEAAAAHPDLALAVVDVMLPDASGADVIGQLLDAAPALPILVLSAHDDAAAACAVLEAGARGFISKRSPTRVVVEALRLVMIGGTYVPPVALHQSARAVHADAPRTPAAEAARLGLTRRQLDVLALLMQGEPNKMICRKLNLAEGTVKTHTAAIYRALNVSNRTQAVYAANRLGIGLEPRVTAHIRQLEPQPSAPAFGPRAPARVPARFELVGTAH